MALIGGPVRWFLAAAALVVFALVAVVIVRHNLRIRRLRQTYKKLPEPVKEQVIELIREAAEQQSSVTFLRLGEENTDGDQALLQSHVGGVPYAEAGDEWPSGDPAKFLLQVRLEAPT